MRYTKNYTYLNMPFDGFRHSKHLWCHQYNQGSRHIQHLPKFSCVPLLLLFNFLVRTLNMRYTFLTNFGVHHALLLAIVTIIQQISRIYSPSITETLHPLNNNSPFPSTPQPLATTILFSVSMSLTILETLDKWNQI